MRSEKLKTADRRLMAVNLHSLARCNLNDMLPLEYMLALMRADIPDELDDKTKLYLQDQKLDVANKAAPYIHPKLQAIDARVEGNMRLEVVTGIPDRDDFDAGVSLEPPRAEEKLPSVENEPTQLGKLAMANVKKVKTKKKEPSITGKLMSDEKRAALDAELLNDVLNLGGS